MSSSIPVIDIFAGPGGLGEGFSSYRPQKGRPDFELRLSIEKDPWAVETLRLRAFRRQFGKRLPDRFHRLLKEGVTKERIKALMDESPKAASVARAEVWEQTLGLEHAEIVRERVQKRLPKGVPWVLIGGPPCQAYSLAGRSRNRGISEYVPDADHRQTLYVEYLQIIADHEPAVFVMENVKGLLSARVSNRLMFERILDDLHDPSAALKKLGRKSHGSQRPRYRVVPVVPRSDLSLFDTSNGFGSPSDYVVRSERYGVPQARHRVILLGIREDAATGTAGTLIQSRAPSVEDVLGDLPRLRSGITDREDTDAEWRQVLKAAGHGTWLTDCPDDVGRKIRGVSKSPSVPRAKRGGEFVPYESSDSSVAARWGGRVEEGVCNHTTRAHITADLERYLFCSAWAWCRGKSPELIDLPTALLPNHLNILLAMGGSHFADRFRVQVRSEPSTTITSHIAKDGHYYIHYDPEQCRSLTVREAARLQTFPDDYVFVGPRTSQYHQVGNAVPPYLARQIAKIVADLI